MFNNNNKVNTSTSMATPQTQTTGAMFNALTSGSKIIGTVIADSDIRIDGIIEGDVKCSGKIVIGEKGLLKGTILCQNCEIQGKMEGKVQVNQTLTLRSSANIQAEVNTQVLIVEPNAIFNGTCSMGKTVAQPQQQQPQQQQQAK